MVSTNIHKGSKSSGVLLERDNPNRDVPSGKRTKQKTLELRDIRRWSPSRGYRQGEDKVMSATAAKHVSLCWHDVTVDIIIN